MTTDGSVGVGRRPGEGGGDRLMGEIHRLNVILSEFFSTCRTLPVPTGQVQVDAGPAEEVEAPGDGHLFEPVVAH